MAHVFDLDTLAESDELVVNAGGETYPVTPPTAKADAQFASALSGWLGKDNTPEADAAYVDEMVALVASWVPGLDIDALTFQQLLALATFVRSGGDEGNASTESPEA